jgi:glucosamine-6-phosphate deaminase
LGQAAALAAAEIVERAIAQNGHANLVFASGNSQLTFLQTLRELPGLNWSRVRAFHMDEWLDVPPEHPARFDAFMRRHLLETVQPGAFYPVRPDQSDAEQACRAYEQLLRDHPADLCICGIGEAGHLAFNDPPYADFDDPRWVKVVEINETSRRQQAGEGHFPNFEAVPRQAITLTIPALLAARRVLCLAPEARKARIVAAVLAGPVSEACPATILRHTPHARLYLDRDSSAGLPADWT